jgi:serine/threonine protein kinase
VSFATTEQSKIGTTVANKYRLVRVLGRGGMGIVYEAQHQVTGRRVAIKVMHPENQLSQENVQRFMNEANAAGRIQHPNVVEVLDAGQDTDDGSLYIVLELLRGIDLANYLIDSETGMLTPRETLVIVCQVLQALIAAHHAGIVHRDIKPENIFLTRNNAGDTQIKIVDFGISKAVNPEEQIPLSVTQANTTVGTPHYMSPEQAKGESIDPRSDIWSIGVVMYEALTSRLPFDGENFNTQIVAVVTEQHVPARRFGVDKDLSAVIDRCLQKDRDKRFSDASDMLAALRKYTEKHPEHAIPQVLLTPPDEAQLKRVRGMDSHSRIEIAPPAMNPAPAVLETVEEVPVFPGMVPIDEADADNAPTALNSTDSERRARRYRTRDASGYHSRWTDASGSPRLSALVAVGAVAAVTTALLSHTVYKAYKDARPPVVLATPPGHVKLDFRHLPRGGTVDIEGRRYNDETVYVPRSSRTAHIRVEAPGYSPLDFQLTLDRNQEVMLPPLQATPQALTPEHNNTPDASHAPDPPRPSSRPSGGTNPVAEITSTPSPYGDTLLSVGGSGCTVSIDRQPVGPAPVTNRAVPPGRHQVSCAWADAGTRSQDINVTAGQAVRVVF